MTKVNIQKNSTPHYIYGSSSLNTPYISGTSWGNYTSSATPSSTLIQSNDQITFTAETDDYKDIEELQTMTEPIKEVKSRFGILKNCHITSIDINIHEDDAIATCEFTAEMLDPVVEVTFKYGDKKIIPVSIYNEVRESQEKMPEDMTMGEFEQAALAVQI